MKSNETNEQSQASPEKKRSRKGLIFNIFYIIFAALSLGAGALLGSGGILSFLNDPLGLPVAVSTVNGWALLSVFLACVFLYAIFLEQKAKGLWLLGTIFFLVALTASVALSVYPLTETVAATSFIFAGESLLVGAVITVALYLLCLPFLLCACKKKRKVAKKRRKLIIVIVHGTKPSAEKTASDEKRSSVVAPALSRDGFDIHPALPSAFIRHIHSDGLYLRSGRDYLPLARQFSPDGFLEYAYRGSIKKGYLALVRIEKGRELPVPEKREKDHGYTLEGEARNVLEGSSVLTWPDETGDKTLNYINPESSWRFVGREDRRYGFFIRLCEGGSWVVIYAREEE